MRIRHLASDASLPADDAMPRLLVEIAETLHAALVRQPCHALLRGWLALLIQACQYMRSGMFIDGKIWTYDGIHIFVLNKSLWDFIWGKQGVLEMEVFVMKTLVESE